MREIKFRAFVDGAMIYNVPINKDGKYVHMVSKGFAVQYDPMYKDYDVDQYTGLKDMNGKEIYEGDIVTIKNDDRLFYLSWFDDMSFGFDDLRNFNSGLGYECYDTSDGFPLDCSIEIIGNIYENPELLI